MWLELLRKNGDVPYTVIVANKCDLDKAVDDRVSSKSVTSSSHYFPGEQYSDSNHVLNSLCLTPDFI